MIYIDSQRCDGCGICLDTCPTGAIVLRDNIAFVEQSLCEDCRVCMDKCPRGAILWSEQLVDVVEVQPLSTAPASKVEILPPVSKAKPVSIPLGAAVGTALVEVLPRLASLVMNWLERRPRSIETSTQDAKQISAPDRNASQQGSGRGQGQGLGRGPGQGQGRGRGPGKHRQQRGNR